MDQRQLWLLDRESIIELTRLTQSPDRQERFRKTKPCLPITRINLPRRLKRCHRLCLPTQLHQHQSVKIGRGHLRPQPARTPVTDLCRFILLICVENPPQPPDRRRVPSPSLCRFQRLTNLWARLLAIATDGDRRQLRQRRRPLL